MTTLGPLSVRLPPARATRRRASAGVALPALGLVLPAAALSAIGLLLVWSATRGRPGSTLPERQAISVGIGFALMWAVSRIDLRLLRAYVPLLYLLGLAGLVAVLTPLGRTINGSHAWIVLGNGLQFQPSEFAKAATLLALATILGELRDGERRPGAGAVLLALGVAAVPVGLIALQPDHGTALVFLVLTFGMIAVSGAPKRWFAAFAAAGAAGVLLVWRLDLIRPYQLQRLMVLADPDADPMGVGYNATQARIAIGSGGLLGKGLFHGEQTAGHFVPEQHTDFIFTVAGEELGFLGGACVILLMLALLWRGLWIAARSPSPFGTVLAGGVVCWLAFQTFVNVGMTMGLLPIAGLPLPFVSYGGSATISSLAAVGLLAAVNRRTRTPRIRQSRRSA
ncbi:rod shape-determining protein RodA [Microbispora triticiradicis]|uniref:peptidoglycan glycosyltransferase n=1 Tax=Microbispora triticiradicis TaxID=2200763 RepID=A0ABX9LDV4_9ACTN|nr:rod shape-determining protein RodA [Microbispora triticiradicis]RGA02157.1 rod shape-determining protein RodA [Microbispora triticiradicis]GLW24776.1 rod shape-determining protein RodA [Microbispora amethystogenes]